MASMEIEIYQLQLFRPLLCGEFAISGSNHFFNKQYPVWKLFIINWRTILKSSLVDCLVCISCCRSHRHYYFLMMLDTDWIELLASSFICLFAPETINLLTKSSFHDMVSSLIFLNTNITRPTSNAWLLTFESICAKTSSKIMNEFGESNWFMQTLL